MPLAATPLAMPSSALTGTTMPVSNTDGLTQSPGQEAPDKLPSLNVTAPINRQFGEKLIDTPADRNAANTAPPSQAVVSALTQSTPSAPSTPNENPIPRELVPLVQQQLNGLATQNFVWQGQVWPGQPMWWEISGEQESKPGKDNEPASQWQTRLKLDLPALGGIDVSLRLGAGGTLAIAVNTENPASETKLRDSAQVLRDKLTAAGLTLTQLRVDYGQNRE
jgi:hypothetical protein